MRMMIIMRRRRRRSRRRRMATNIRNVTMAFGAFCFLLLLLVLFFQMHPCISITGSVHWFFYPSVGPSVSQSISQSVCQLVGPSSKTRGIIIFEPISAKGGTLGSLGAGNMTGQRKKEPLLLILLLLFPFGKRNRRERHQFLFWISENRKNS